MDPKDKRDEQPGTSSTEYTYDTTEFSELLVKVEKLKEYNFEQGVALTWCEICSAIEILAKDINIFNSSLEYKEFLQQYGSIYGEGFKIYGPIINKYDGSKVDDLVYTQNNFINFVEQLGIGLELKFCWSIAYYKRYFYYIDSSSRGKGRIYRMGSNGVTELYAKNFLDFLDAVFRNFILKKLDSVS